MAAIYSNGSNRWNILGFNFNKRDALSSVYKIFYGINRTEKHIHARNMGIQPSVVALCAKTGNVKSRP